MDADVERKAIARVLDDWHAAAASADESRYFARLDGSAIFLGTDATERWSKTEFLAFAHPFFARGRAWSFRPHHRHVMFAATSGADGGAFPVVAWFDEELETPNLGPARGTGVVVKKSDVGWVIVHYNLALTIPNDRAGDVKRMLETPK